MTFQLSGQGLRHVLINLHTCDFVFEFSNIEVKFPSLLAEFISPKASEMRKKDPTITRMKINYAIKDLSGTIEQLQMLITGQSIPFTEQEMNHEISTVLLALGNNEILSTPPYKAIKLDNVMDMIKIKKENNALYEDELNFCALNFEELKEQLMDSNVLAISDYSMIFTSEKLRLQNEYSLLSFIKEKMDSDNEYFILLKHVKSEYLTDLQMKEFVRIVDTLEIEKIGSLWTSLRERYLNQCPSALENRHRDILYAYNGHDKWNGIIAGLRKKSGGNNIVDEKIIQMEANSISQGSIKSLTDGSEDVMTSDTNNSYFIFDFFDKKVEVSSYSLKSPTNMSRYMKSWKLEGSNDKSSWAIIDEKNNLSDLTSSGREFTYRVNSSLPYRYIRIMQISPNTNNSYNFALRQIEFFGLLCA